MIWYIVTKQHTYTLGSYLKTLGKSLVERFGFATYEDLLADTHGAMAFHLESNFGFNYVLDFDTASCASRVAASGNDFDVETLCACLRWLKGKPLLPAL